MKKQIQYFILFLSITGIIIVAVIFKIKILLVLVLAACVIGLIKGCWELAKTFSDEY